MHILINGGTGFIGSKLCEHFVDSGYKVDVLTRSVRNETNTPKRIKLLTDLNHSERIYDVIINLSGEPLNKHRWNNSIKRTILDSRVQSTQKIIDYIKKCHEKPKLLISGSAIGFYGHSSDQIFTEDSPPATNEFIHEVCADWEEKAREASNFGVRVCILRTGIVLGKDGGALAEMLLPFKFGLGAQLGDGTQWMSWVHMDDVVRIIDFLIHEPCAEGAYNMTAPTSVTNAEFVDTLASVLHRPRFIALPNFTVNLLFGEMGKALLLQGQNVIPARVLKAGYIFKFPTLREALQDIVEK